MKKRRQSPGLKQKEPNAKAGRRMLNPAREPVLPDVLETAATTSDLNEEFVSTSAPLGEQPPEGKPTSAKRTARSASKAKAKKGERAEFFNESAPLEEKPQKFTAVHTRQSSKSRSAIPAPTRKTARRDSR